MHDAERDERERPARILIVDDHPLVRHGLRQLISDEPNLEVCADAEGAAEALHLVETLTPDLVVIDISLKTGSGIELIKAIRAIDDSIKTLVYSMHEELLYAERALRAGARGYVSKLEATDSIIDAIRRVLDGKIAVSDQMSERLLARIAQQPPESYQDPISSLTDRELEIFELFGKGFTTREVADHLNRSIKTIETHRERISRKLDLRNASEFVRRATQWVVDRS